MADFALEAVFVIIGEVRALVQAAQELKNTSRKVLSYVACAEIIARRIRQLPEEQQQELLEHESSPLTLLESCLKRVKALLKEVAELDTRRFRIPGSRTVTKGTYKTLLLDSGTELNEACSRIGYTLTAILTHMVASGGGNGGGGDAGQGGALTDWESTWRQTQQDLANEAAQIPDDEVPVPKPECVAKAVLEMRRIVSRRKAMLETLQQAFTNRSNQTTLLLDVATGLRENLGMLETRIKDTQMQFQELKTSLTDTATQLQRTTEGLFRCAEHLNDPPSRAPNAIQWHDELRKQLYSVAAQRQKMDGLVARMQNFDSAGRPARAIDVEGELSDEFSALGDAFKRMRVMVDGLSGSSDAGGDGVGEGDGAVAASVEGSGEAKGAETGEDAPPPPPPTVEAGLSSEQILNHHQLRDKPKMPTVTELREAAKGCEGSIANAQTAWAQLGVSKDALIAYRRWHIVYANLFQQQMWPRVTRDYQACHGQLARVVNEAQANTRMSHCVLQMTTSAAAFEDVISLSGHVTMLIDGVRDRLAQFERVVNAAVWEAVSLMAVTDHGGVSTATLTRLYKLSDTLEEKIDYLRNAMDRNEIPDAYEPDIGLDETPADAALDSADDYEGTVDVQLIDAATIAQYTNANGADSETASNT